MTKILNVSEPNFFTQLSAALKENEDGVPVMNFLGTGWNVYYNLYNPENFEDPVSSPEWYDSSNVYDYRETAFRDGSIVLIVNFTGSQTHSALKNLIEDVKSYEQKLLQFFVSYTFGNGGAYAAGIHFEYARRTMEILHQRNLSQEDFIVRNICLNTIELCDDPDELFLDFHCGWDFEHGVSVRIKSKEISFSK